MSILKEDAFDDKVEECNRYDKRAANLLATDHAVITEYLGALSIPLPLRSPYLFFEEKIARHVTQSTKVLEIGSGTGLHTGTLLGAGGEVIATDISPSSLKVLRLSHKCNDRLQTQVADMEALPFSDAFFDVVTSAGSLSYGDNDVVLSEIYRVLKPSGMLIAVDSLNNNPVYRFNRYLHYLRNNRTKSTLVRMPTIKLIQKYERNFGKVDVKYFGSISWLMLFLGKFLSSSDCAYISDSVNAFIKPKRSAFKFVMVATKTN